MSEIEIKRVFIVNGWIRVQITGLDLHDDVDPSVEREFNVYGAGEHPDTKKPILKLEYEKNPNGSGVLFLDIDDVDLERILNQHRETVIRGEVGMWEDKENLMKTHPEGLRGDRPDFKASDPAYHGTITR